MSSKLRVAVLFGGRSAEHEVSLQSARNVIRAIDTAKYDVLPIGIDKQGTWRLLETAHGLDAPDTATDPIALDRIGEPVTLAPRDGRPEVLRLADGSSAGPLDVVFPVLHGPFGEDGTVQGLLKLANVPFVGAGVLGSAVGMDKDVMKRLLRDAGIPIPRFLVCDRATAADIRFADLTGTLGAPLFVKPANLGSSVGVTKVGTERELRAALSDALRYDNKLIIEQSIAGRELECSVLGNEEPIASIPGEIVPHHAFYSYEAKYLDADGAALEIPAHLSAPLTRRVQELAVRTFKVLCCAGLARVDFFLRDGDELLVNEINTIPGFTKISMYPKLWEASGVPPAELIDRLIQLALARFRVERALQTSFA